MANLEKIRNLSFLEASRIVSKRSNSQQNSLNIQILGSSQLEALELYVKALFKEYGYEAFLNFLPFNTLQQFLINPSLKEANVLIIFPWDLCSFFDWRTGVLDNSTLKYTDVCESVDNVINRLKTLTNTSIIYVNASIPPYMANRRQLRLVSNMMLNKVDDLCDEVIDRNKFSLANYLSHGFPFVNSELSEISFSCVRNILMKEPKKILVTDFDNVMWKGVIGEDGVNGIKCNNDDDGFPHYLYQNYLKFLKSKGVLIAAVTRNDDQLASAPFEAGITHLEQQDFVKVLASYNAKSSQIEGLLKSLNLSLDSCVFIDDNPLEIQEVHYALHDVTCIRFPTDNNELESFFESVSSLFDLGNITSEDANRTELYKARAASLEISESHGSDLTEFLLGLNMSVSVKHCNVNNCDRTIQLINKTNQFNSNGQRVDAEYFKEYINHSFEAYTFSLTDKFGQHGEILTIVLDQDNEVRHFVMSCRVFQREIEKFALLWLHTHQKVNNIKIDFVETQKNIPFKSFMSSLNTTNDGNIYFLDLKEFAEQNLDTNKLFKLEA